MKASDLRDLPYDKLAERLAEAKEELFNLRFQLATNQLDKTARLRDLRREVARISTVMRQQEIDAYFKQQEGGSRG
ncbi:MAG: 50S ribosomal protein L29 [Actinobacteria bacterium RBG_16_70_17]|jgi:large subunit ribosomal protein L29|nr:MAG: 50S ribosomal protein L29 [Actinobacteria bacterium RBG_16_70_17]